MDRKIKFRAFDNRNNNMFKVFDSTTQHEWYLPHREARYDIMQYTELNDKNGVEAFGNDIFVPFYKTPFGEATDELDYDHKGFIWFGSGCYQVKMSNGISYKLFTMLEYTKGEHVSNFGCPIVYGSTLNGVIIGNIYENSELL